MWNENAWDKNATIHEACAVRGLDVNIGSLASESASFDSDSVTSSRHRAPMGPDSHYFITYKAAPVTRAIVTSHSTGPHTFKQYVFK